MNDKKARCVVVGGADIQNYDRIRAALRTDDFLIYCDSGLKHLDGLGVKPDLIVGDFDSWENPKAAAETIVLPVVKDDTDTAFAVKEALRRGFSDFLLLGVIGGRLDHSLANLQLLYLLDGLGKTALALDDRSEIGVVSRAPAFVTPQFSYFSLLNLTGEAKGVCIEGAKYDLQDAVIPCDDPYAVSNEPLPGQTAKITVGSGRLLLIRDLPDCPERQEPAPESSDTGPAREKLRGKKEKWSIRWSADPQSSAELPENRIPQNQ